VQDGLPLFATTRQVEALTIPLQLDDVPPNRAPAPDLARIIAASATKEIAAIPLKPTARILFVNPATISPNRQRLGRVDAKAIQCRIVLIWTQLGLIKPLPGKFGRAIRHVLAAKNSKSQHLLW
jgi:hypothetical protein